MPDPNHTDSPNTTTGGRNAGAVGMSINEMLAVMLAVLVPHVIRRFELFESPLLTISMVSALLVVLAVTFGRKINSMRPRR
jgi:hypothetical protein